MLFSTPSAWVNPCCLCFFFGLVLWPLGHSLLFIYVPFPPPGKSGAMFSTSPWHQHPIWGLAQGRHHEYSMSWKWLNFLMAWPCLWCHLLFPRFGPVAPGQDFLFPFLLLSRIIEACGLFQVEQNVLFSSVHLLLVFLFSLHHSLCP